jgi:hypothetical protein
MEVAGEDGRNVTESGKVPRLVDAARIDSIVAALCELERRNGIDRTLAVGELILTQFFAGDPALWRDRRRNKNNSIRRLAARKDCPFCKSALNEAVAVSVAVRELPCIRTFGHIGASHVACVLSLASEQQRDMLQMADQGRLSVRELRRRVVSARRASGERRGRPATDAAMHLLKAAETDARRLAESIDRLRPFMPFADALSSRLRVLASAVDDAASELRACVEASGPGVTRVSSVDLRAQTG